MSAITNHRNHEHVLYNPQVHGLADGSTDIAKFWEATSGTISISSNKLRVNNAAVATLSSYLYAHLRMVVNLPVEPTAGQAKFWGFDPLLGAGVDGARGRIGFLIDATAFKVVAYDIDGNQIIAQTLTFNTDWDTADTIFEIVVNTSGIFFSVNGTVVAKADVSGFSARGSTAKRISDLPCFVYISNGNADNMDIASVLIRNIAKLN